MSSHTLITRQMLPLDPVRQFFDRLRTCNPKELSVAVEWVSTTTAIRLSIADCSRSLTLFAKDRGILISNPDGIIEALFSLEGVRSALGWSGSQLVDFLVKDAVENRDEKPETVTQEFREQLLKFFANEPKLEGTLKAQRIYDGLLPNFDSCSSMVEFRPVFDDARREIIHGIIAATLTLNMRSTDPTAEIQKISVQLDAADLNTLSAEVARLRNKMEALQSLVSGKVTLLNPTKSLRAEDEL